MKYSHLLIHMLFPPQARKRQRTDEDAAIIQALTEENRVLREENEMLKMENLVLKSGVRK